MSGKPPQKSKGGDTVEVKPPFHYTLRLIALCVPNEAQRSAFDRKIVAHQLTDSFLPSWTISSLKERVGLTKEQASVFIKYVRDLQQKHALPKTIAPSEDDYTAVLSKIDAGQFGGQRIAIDNYVRQTGVMCDKTNVSHRVRSIFPAGHVQQLSSAAINTINDLLFNANTAIDSKPVLLERRHASSDASAVMSAPPRASHLRDILREHCEDPAPVVTDDYIDASLTVEELDLKYDLYQPLTLTSKPHSRVGDAMHAQVQAALALHTAGRLPPRHSR